MRNLKDIEIEQMKVLGCSAENWSAITVDDDFNTESYRCVTFRGRCHLGTCRGMHHSSYYEHRPSGVSHVVLEDCFLGREVLIEHVNDVIRGYRIGDNVTIAHIAQLKADEGATFAIGAPIAVLDEMGGRTVYISNHLSAQLAYITAFAKHDEDLQRHIASLVEQEAKQVAEQGAFIGEGSTLLYGGIFQNVCIGQGTYIEGPVALKNGTVADAVKIEGHTSANTFWIGRDSLLQGVTLLHTFVGEGCHLSGGFYAHDSLIFANSTLANGECAAAFLAPYTVSMHRSTLLIGGLFSFFNAGSGTNQSNHHYRLGAMHYGILERGVKFASDAYVLWPAHIGAFSKVFGRIYTLPNTEDFPFSEVRGEGNKTLLYPALTLVQVGTWRDLFKWSKRERRSETTRSIALDTIDFRWEQSALIQSCFRAWTALTTLSLDQFFKLYKVTITSGDMVTGAELYRRLLTIVLATSLKGAIAPTDTSLLLEERYIDLAGVSLSLSAYKDWVLKEQSTPSTSTNELKKRLEVLCKEAQEQDLPLLWKILFSLYPEYENLPPSTWYISLKEQALKDALHIEKLVLKDASRELMPQRAMNFGILAEDREDLDADFKAVRGEIEEHSFIAELKKYFASLRDAISTLTEE